MKLLIKGGRVIDPANGIEADLDLLAEDGRVARLARRIGASKVDMVIDAAGQIVMPGFIDMHVHLREPGFEYKETIGTGCRAAAAGGFTTICAMPNTDPAADNPAVISYVKNRAREEALVEVLPVGCITKGMEGQELAEMDAMARAGAVAFSDDGRPVMTSEVMRRALQYSRIGDWLLMAHEEDLDLVGEGQMHEGFFSTYYGLRGIPAAAEEVMVARDLILAQATGGRLHVCHASTAGTLELIRQAKGKGIKVTCEVTPHHLTLTDEMLASYDTSLKVNPPLRSREDVEALRQGLIDGTIDVIATDHAPHDQESKDCEFVLAANGISGIETAVAVIMHYLVNPGLLPLSRLAELMSAAPARILNINRGTLRVGNTANITVIDPGREKRVDTASFASLGRNNPYHGQILRGWPVATIVAGEPVMLDGALLR